MNKDVEVEFDSKGFKASEIEATDKVAEEVRQAKELRDARQYEQKVFPTEVRQAEVTEVPFSSHFVVYDQDEETGNDIFSICASKEQAITIYYALERTLEVLRKDLTTKYDNSPKYCIEDDAFLGTEIGKVATMMFELEQVNVLL